MRRIRTLGVATALAVPALPLGLAGAGPAQAAGHTYYVSPGGSDSNSGTSAGKALRTIQEAADRTEPGDTVSIMNGTYKEPRKGSDVVSVTRSGKAGAPITFRAHPGHKPVINPVTGWNGIAVDGASYIDIRGLEIKGNSAHLSLSAAEGASTKNPLYNTNCLNVTKGKSSGEQAHHINIVGNTVRSCPGSGISAIDADHVTIDRNRVHSTSWYTKYATSGISVLRALDSDGSGDGKKYRIRITNNVSYDNETKVKWDKCTCYSDGNGIIIDTLKGKPGGEGPDYRGRVLVANNLSFDNGGSGIHSFQSHHVDIVHNTAYMNGRSKNMDSYANIFAAKSQDVRLLNNISYARPGQETNSKHRNTDVTYDYNTYFNGKAPEVKGPHDVVGDPEFVAPGTGPAAADFRLRKGSRAIGTGTAFPAVSTDITGARRGGGDPDRGAYAFSARTNSSAAATTDPTRIAGAGAGQHPGTSTGTGTGAAGTATGEGGEKTMGGSTSLAETGGSLAALGGGAVVLAVGMGIVVRTRRKRS